MPLLLYNRAILEKICMNRKTVADLDLSGPLHRREFDYIFDGRGASQPERGKIRAACERKSSCLNGENPVATEKIFETLESRCEERTAGT